MTYEQTLEFLFSQLPAYHRIGKAAYKENLDNILALDNYFDHPHLYFKSIHIAGTNGKGSVSHMTASVLQEKGYRTGLYTSPHLLDFRERIKVDGKMIPEEEVIRFVEDHSEIIGQIKPSFFELTVAMAFRHFARENVEVAVIETGLGGRLDSTNIILPVLSVITNIGHDHMDILGDTLQKIAAEKAGIIKKSVPVIISESQTETDNVFILKAKETGSEIVFADKNYRCELNEKFSENQEREYTISDNLSREIIGKTMLGGDYQSKNIQAIWQIFKTLKSDFPVDEGIIIRGIRNTVKNTGLLGRWQIIRKSPLTICDTGHNKEGLHYVLEQIRRIKKSKLHMIIGFVNDKDLSSVLPLLPTDAVYYFTKASVPRALDENILMKKANEYSLNGLSFPDVKSAMEEAYRIAAKKDMIFIGGSTFIVADALK